MKFEHLLQVYWLKGFLCGGVIIPFETPLITLLNQELPGVSRCLIKNFTKRLECTFLFTDPLQLCINLSEYQLHSINVYLSQIMSVNHSLAEAVRLTTIRLYLIKSFRGRCQAIGKPSRGQRTWSNAKNANKSNTILRAFINHFNKTKIKPITPIVFNYRTVQKKFAKVYANPLKKKVVKKKTNLWY